MWARPPLRGSALLAYNIGLDVLASEIPSDAWRHVFSVGFPLDLATSEAPPLFLADGGDVALVNYRVIGNRYVVDRLFEVAELRLGGARQTIVRISRERPRPVRRRR